MKLFSQLVSLPTGLMLMVATLAGSASSYFVITEPQRGSTFANGAPNLVKWSKGLFDGVNEFDIELSRLSTDGLLYVARNVPVTPPALNIYLDSLPTGDDYFLLFINVTHGVMYATSPRFTISSTANSSSPSPDASAPTVTISGSPDPTKGFATTLAGATSGGVVSILPSQGGLVGMGGLLAGCLVGAVWTVW